jgi:hypothetical protein
MFKHAENTMAAEPKTLDFQRFGVFSRDKIRAGVLKAAQFPAALTDAHGTFTKLAAW